MFCEQTLVVQERKWTELCPSSSSSSSVLCARLLELVFVCLWTSTVQWKRSLNQNSKWKAGLTQAQTKLREVTEGLLIQKSLATLSFFYHFSFFFFFFLLSAQIKSDFLLEVFLHNRSADRSTVYILGCVFRARLFMSPNKNRKT